MTDNNADRLWEEETRADARRIEDEVMANPDRPYPEGVEYTVTQPNLRRHLFSVRLSDDEYATLQQIAAARHLPASTMARAWLLDRLREEQQAS